MEAGFFNIIYIVIFYYLSLDLFLTIRIFFSWWLEMQNILAVNCTFILFIL